MAYWRHYHLPTSVDEALSLLAGHQGRARVVAGGTDLILDLQDGRHPPLEALVDVTRIAEMRAITRQDGYIFLGAAATHAQIERSPLLRRHAACLVESCGVVGGPQVRNVATIGGNVAHALPAADGTVSLLALDAEGLVAMPGRRTWRPLADLFRGPGRSAVDSRRELLVGLRFAPMTARQASAFYRIMRPQGVALPILAVAACLRLAEDLVHFQAVRLAIGPAGPLPFRAGQAENLLQGAGRHDSAAIDQAVAAAQAQARLRTSRHRATAAYRREMLDLLLRRALATAGQRAQQIE